MLFEESLGKKVLNVFQDFWASGLTSGSEGKMNSIGCCNSEKIPPFKKKKKKSLFKILRIVFFRKSISNNFILRKSLNSSI